MGKNLTAKEVLDELEMWRKEKKRRDDSRMIHTDNLRAKILALRSKL